MTKRQKDKPRDVLAWKGAEGLRSLLRQVTEVEPDARNARKHPERNIEAIKASLLRFGQRKPVVVRDGIAIAGNGTVHAMRELGWTHVAVIDASDLTPEEARAYSIADNKTGDLAEWDFAELGAAFREMPDDLLVATGFASFEIEPLLAASWRPTEGPAATTSESSASAAGFISYRASLEQAKIINEAVSRVRSSESATDMPEGRALELICADYIAGSSPAE